MKLLVKILVVLSVVAGLAAGDGYAQVYCGRRLAQTLGALCSTNYMAKRAGYGLYEVAGLEGWGPPGLEPWGAAWVPARVVALSGARGKRQVVSECCMKACTLDELLTYC